MYKVLTHKMTIQILIIRDEDGWNFCLSKLIHYYIIFPVSLSYYHKIVLVSFARILDPQQVKRFQRFTIDFISDSDNDVRLANVLTYFIVFAVTVFPHDIHFPDNFMRMNNQSSLWWSLTSSTYTILLE